MPPGRVSSSEVRGSAAGPGQLFRGQGKCRRAGSALQRSGVVPALQRSGVVPPGRVSSSEVRGSASSSEVRGSAAGPGQLFRG